MFLKEKKLIYLKGKGNFTLLANIIDYKSRFQMCIGLYRPNLTLMNCAIIDVKCFTNIT